MSMIGGRGAIADVGGITMCLAAGLARVVLQLAPPKIERYLSDILFIIHPNQRKPSAHCYQKSTTCTMGESTEDTKMELSLSLDADGRTKYDPQTINIEPDAKRLKTSDDNEDASLPTAKTLDYSSKTIQTNLSNISQQQETAMNDLLFDCEIADSGLLPRTFWISADGDTDTAKPRCYLEKLALEVFHHHVPNGYVYDKSTSGAEWWVQLVSS